MVDDRKRIRTINALEEFRRSATAGQRRAIPILRDDDTVRLGPPPGVPRTVTEPDLGAVCRAAVARLLAAVTLGRPQITTGTDDRIVDLDVSVRLTAREVDRLVELAANLPPTGR